MIYINPGYTLKQVVDEHVIIATGDNAIKFSAVLVLNEVGVKVFKLIQAGLAELEIARTLMTEYAIDELTAEADVARFVDRLVQDGVCSRE